ncbi:MAG: AMP-binding protein [Clostridia bacterium]|nr:AMP-binding protein [Clostridia bacterium]
MVRTPWYAKMGVVPCHLEYQQCSMEEAVEKIAEKYPKLTAYNFLGTNTKYPDLVKEIRACAAALKACGVRPGEKVTICLPNMPMAIAMFYGVNMIGAIANMIHPLSAEGEIEFYLNDSESVAAITVDMFYQKFENIRRNTPKLKTMIVCSIKDGLNPLMKVGYQLTKGRKIAPLPKDGSYLTWKEFLAKGKGMTDVRVSRAANDPAVILYSGGTTGVTKGILLSNLNFNALGAQIIATNPMFAPGDKMLAIMPMFHGFGLGVSIHSMLVNGGQCILVPQFTPKTYAELLRKHHPNFIAGVPTLYEALLRIDGLEKLDLSCLKGVFSGGDSLSVELKKRFDAFLHDHGAKISVREGYGTTECVTASCLTPIDEFREGSIGIPFPDTYYKIVKVGTEEEVPYGTEGEICLAGPTVMLKYVNHPEETANTRRVHADGMTWIHTGDLGMMDSDGFVYFRQRIKRMIITSGYNVYPSQIENILDAHEYVHMSCVIGVKDPYKMQKVKAFVMLKPGIEPSDAIKKELLDYCRTKIARYAMPYDIEFRAELPKTLVGKVAYRVLEQEAGAGDSVA